MNESITKFFEEVSNMVKSIGTSSSINEERDERSVENYVRDGGNIMSNTTEPDPKGDIAVTKAVGSVTNPNGDVSVSNAPEGTVPTNETFPSEATSAIAPSKTDEVNTPETVTKAEAGKCASCGQALPVEKADEPKDADEITKAATCPDCGKSMELCNCMGKAVDEKETPAEAAKETPADEKAEMKKSLWGGAFAPRK
jgi:DNA-directed RNA polymerase subunit RPC12/RpoP